jgi:hypothetical protein
VTRTEALAKANRVRAEQRYLAATIRLLSAHEGRERVAALLEDGGLDGGAGTITIGRLLRSIRGYGDVKADRAVDHVRVDRDRRVRDLTDRQRTRIAAWLRYGL